LLYKSRRFVYLILKSARPRQWIKNLALYAPLFFSGFLFFKPLDGPAYFWIVTYAVLLFSVLTSSIYLINDLIDVKEDRQHPFKKHRPIASGQLPVPLALTVALLGLALVFFLVVNFACLFPIAVVHLFCTPNALCYSHQTHRYF